MSRLRTSSVIVILTAVALLIRSVIAARGGLWADEGFFLSVVQAPSWMSMLTFLAAHESHPPLFYIVMRAWLAIAGDTDAAVRMLPVLIATAVIPVVYMTGASLFSFRAGLFAALLTAIAPSMSEHGAQLRPYGLLALAALVSCWAMVRCIETGTMRNRVVYVIATLAMLYAHHWGWLIAAGEHLAFVYVIVTRRGDLGRLVREWAGMWIVIAAGYAPWLSALASQSVKAGHGGIPVDAAADALMLVAYAAFTFFSTLVPGRFAPQEIVAGVSLLLAGCAAVYMNAARGQSGGDQERHHGAPRGPAGAVIGITCSGSLALAVLLSPFSNLLLPRCLTAVLPLLAVLFADWCVRTWQHDRERPASIIAAVLCSILLTNAAFESYVLATTPRSNAREAARLVASRSQPTDLVLVAPAWYRPSLSRYLTPSLEVAEFPHSETGALVDFSNVWERVSDVSEMERIMRIVSRASSANRRVWLVTSTQYARPVSDSELAGAMKHHHPKPVTVSAVNRIRAGLEQQLGAADSTLMEHERKPLYDDVRVYLHDPRRASR